MFAVGAGRVLKGEFVDQAPVPMDQIAAYLNFDMVGRLRENKLTVQAVGSSTNRAGGGGETIARSLSVWLFRKICGPEWASKERVIPFSGPIWPFFGVSWP